MVTHSEAHASRADRVVHMLDGRFIDARKYSNHDANYLATALRNLFAMVPTRRSYIRPRSRFAAIMLIALFVRDEYATIASFRSMLACTG